jgi:hypothetical protein
VSCVFQTLSEGMLVLGCVYEVQEYNVLVSLPGRLIGHVPVTNISSPYTQYLKDLVDGVAVEEVRHYCGNCETVLLVQSECFTEVHLWSRPHAAFVMQRGGRQNSAYTLILNMEAVHCSVTLYCIPEDAC